MQTKVQHKNIAVYARVSTEHEAQLSALENQLEWYQEILNKYPEWKLYSTYVDEGITGTQAKKRPQFLKMIDDAKNGCFDLIITREVSRFARNTVDTLQITRDLKKYDVEVYFVEDNIWTFDGDGELRLTIMASLSQDESRKISVRVKAGQASSRRQGVLYGNGNILGYNRVGNTYIINEEQAESVRTIFDLYSKGYGIRVIVTEMEKRGLKNSIGTTKWHMSTIQRVLSNTTYKGYMTYGKSYSTDYLEQTRKTNYDESKKMIVKVNIPPIVSEELWDECDKIRKSRTLPCNKDGKKSKYGYKKAQCIWLNKLKCKCGASMRRDKWRANKNGEVAYGYQCYNRIQNGSKKYREEKGLDATDACDVKMIAEWKLKIMAKYIFENLWKDKANIIRSTYNIIKENYDINEVEKHKKEIERLQNEINKNQQRINNLIELRIDGEISKDEFNMQKERYSKQIEIAQETINQLNLQINQNSMLDLLNDIDKALQDLVYKEEISDSLIDKAINKIVVKGNDVFDWYLCLSDNPISLKVHGDMKHNPIYVTDSTGCFSTKLGYLLILTFTISKEQMRVFQRNNGTHIKTRIARDLIVNIYAR